MEHKYTDHVKLMLRASGMSDEEIELSEARMVAHIKFMLQDPPTVVKPISENIRKKFESSHLTPFSTYVHPSKPE